MSDKPSPEPASETKTILEWGDQYFESARGSDEEKQAIEEILKLVDQATTLEEWEVVYEVAEVGSELEARAKAKADELRKLESEQDD